MIDKLIKNIQRPPNWFIRISSWLWRGIAFIWSTIILAVLLNIFAVLLTSGSSGIKGTIIDQILQRPGYLLIGGLFLLLFTYIVYLSNRFSVILPEEEDIQRRYLNQIRQD